MDDYNFLDDLFNILNTQPLTTYRFDEFEETIQLNQQIVNNIYNIRRNLEYNLEYNLEQQDASILSYNDIFDDTSHMTTQYDEPISSTSSLHQGFSDFVDTFEDIIYNDININNIQNTFINDIVNIFNQTINEQIEQEFEDVKVTLTPEQFSQLKCEKICDDNIDRYNNKSCNICMDNYNINEEITFLVCNHYFHKDCIKNWLCNEKVTCPVCRKDNR